MADEELSAFLPDLSKFVVDAYNRDFLIECQICEEEIFFQNHSMDNVYKLIEEHWREKHAKYKPVKVAGG